MSVEASGWFVMVDIVGVLVDTSELEVQKVLVDTLDLEVDKVLVDTSELEVDKVLVYLELVLEFILLSFICNFFSFTI